MGSKKINWHLATKVADLDGANLPGEFHLEGDNDVVIRHRIIKRLGKFISLPSTSRKVK